MVARSSIVPVVVDFWAPWCQPCRILSPTLERLERAANGAWQLVTVDIDGEPSLARDFRITSIPALKGFRDGRVVAEMLGAQPEAAVRAFLAGLLPSEADRLVSEAMEELQAGSNRAGGDRAAQGSRAAAGSRPRTPGPGLPAPRTWMSRRGRGDPRADSGHDR